MGANPIGISRRGRGGTADTLVLGTSAFGRAGANPADLTMCQWRNAAYAAGLKPAFYWFESSLAHQFIAARDGLAKRGLSSIVERLVCNQ